MRITFPWGWINTGRPTLGRERWHVHVGSCSHGTAWQIRIGAFGRFFVFLVRKAACV